MDRSFVLITDERMGTDGQVSYFCKKHPGMEKLNLKVHEFRYKGIEYLASVADSLIESDPTSIYYISGGIHDIIRRGPTGQYQFNHTDYDELHDKLQYVIEDSIEYLRQRHPGTIINFTTITGVEVLKTCMWHGLGDCQRVMDVAIYIINDCIELKNHRYGHLTPDLASVVHYYNGDTFVHKYNLHLNDGVDGTLPTIRKWAAILTMHFQLYMV